MHKKNLLKWRKILEPREVDELRLALANAEVQRTKLKKGHLEDQIRDFREHLSKFKTEEFKQIGNYQLAEMLGKNIDDANSQLLQLRRVVKEPGKYLPNSEMDNIHFKTTVNEFGDIVVSSYSLDNGMTFIDLYEDLESYSDKVTVNEYEKGIIKKLQENEGSVEILTSEANTDSEDIDKLPDYRRLSGTSRGKELEKMAEEYTKKLKGLKKEKN